MTPHPAGRPARRGFVLPLCLVVLLLSGGGALGLLHGALMQQRMAAATFERLCADAKPPASRVHCRPCKTRTTSSC